MFEILPNPSLATMLMVGRAVLLIGAFCVFALAFTRWRRAEEARSSQLNAQLERAFGELRSLHETIAVMSGRLDTLTERAEADSRRAPASMNGAQRGYDLATRLARNGAAVEELISSCGITRHEAELLTRLHGGKSAESAAAWQLRAAAPERAPQPQPPAQPAPAAARKRGSLLSVVG